MEEAPMLDRVTRHRSATILASAHGKISQERPRATAVNARDIGR